LFTVFSTCVEVIPKLVRFFEGVPSILHVCGGDPNFPAIFSCFRAYSPRVWRWSSWSSKRFTTCSVFSTCVEVILFCCLVKFCSERILHVCGGDPSLSLRVGIVFRYSPRVWRWSRIRNKLPKFL